MSPFPAYSCKTYRHCIPQVQEHNDNIPQVQWQVAKAPFRTCSKVASQAGASALLADDKCSSWLAELDFMATDDLESIAGWVTTIELKGAACCYLQLPSCCIVTLIVCAYMTQKCILRLYPVTWGRLSAP